MFKERFKKRIALQKQTNLYRDPLEIKRRKGKYVFIGKRKVLSFASNDYLGLCSCDLLKKKIARNFKKYGTSSSSSRLVSGNYSAIIQAERDYAQYFGYEDALFFPSGYQANIGILSTFFERGDTILFDKHIHASSVKGMTLSGASFHGYNHNSMPHLMKRLSAHSKEQVAVITESLFSMDGDLLDIDSFGEIKSRYGFFSIIDEAHAFGVLGEKGRGIAQGVADVALGTFGKALGLFGAFVLLPQGYKEYLFNFSSPLIYTTTLPEAHAASAIDLLEIIYQYDEIRGHLNQVSRLMKTGLIRRGFHVTGDSHILAVKIGNEDKAVDVASELLKRDIFVLPARYPTVPINHAVLRLSMTALHTEEDVRNFITALNEALMI